jgi:transposase-like protein
MPQQDPGRDRLGRRAKLQVATGELSQGEAAERFGIDRSTVMRIRQVAKQGALEALAASKPGVRQAREDAELAAARVELQRLGEAVTEQAIDLVLPTPPGRAPLQRTPWPDGLEYRPTRCGVGR